MCDNGVTPFFFSTTTISSHSHSHLSFSHSNCLQLTPSSHHLSPLDSIFLPHVFQFRLQKWETASRLPLYPPLRSLRLTSPSNLPSPSYPLPPPPHKLTFQLLDSQSLRLQLRKRRLRRRRPPPSQ